jgi:hypothetical protein
MLSDPVDGLYRLPIFEIQSGAFRMKNAVGHHIHKYFEAQSLQLSLTACNIPAYA